MARFLSAAWFARLGELAEPAGDGGLTGDGGPAGEDGEAFVVEQVVERAPEGMVRYHVVFAG
ncbi:MAG: hypothetical protein J2P57_11340, partial [Acidimicrobiaceae bacterium]|nr:hypothetical protein [Acidimicrobiaceae bacterium]